MDRSQHVPLLSIKGQTDALLQLNIPLVILQIKMLFFNLTYANNEEVSFDRSRVHKASTIFYSNSEKINCNTLFTLRVFKNKE